MPTLAPYSQETILANVVQGVRCYLSLVGDTMVPQGFVVPDGEPWPVECRGHKLGESVCKKGLEGQCFTMCLLIVLLAHAVGCTIHLDT